MYLHLTGRSQWRYRVPRPAGARNWRLRHMNAGLPSNLGCLTTTHCYNDFCPLLPVSPAARIKETDNHLTRRILPPSQLWATGLGKKEIPKDELGWVALGCPFSSTGKVFRVCVRSMVLWQCGNRSACKDHENHGKRAACWRAT